MIRIDWSLEPVALVTGGASGIGRASAKVLADRGARVAVLDRDEERGRSVAAEAGGRFFRIDVSSSADWTRTLGEIETDLGPVELAHLNAGVMTLPATSDAAAAADLAALGDETYRHVVGVNVDGVFFGIRSLAAAMSPRARGRIVVTASIAGLAPVPFDPLYAMTKHAVVGLVRSAAPALAGSGIALDAICPGGVDTPLVPDYVRALSLPLLSPLEVAHAVVAILETSPGGGVFVVRPGHPAPEPAPSPAIDLS